MTNNGIVNCEILAAKVDPEKFYPVSYTFKHDGTKVFEQTQLKGKDLTEKQIIELHRVEQMSPAELKYQLLKAQAQCEVNDKFFALMNDKYPDLTQEILDDVKKQIGA